MKIIMLSVIGIAVAAALPSPVLLTFSMVGLLVGFVMEAEE